MSAQLRNRYATDSITTAGPAKLLTMLYDRLVLDLERAEAAQRAGNRPESHEQLIHAQEIIAMLLSNLNTEVWEGGPQLASLYTFMLNELVQANITNDADRTHTVRELILPLRDAWHQAAAMAGEATVASGQPA